MKKRELYNDKDLQEAVDFYTEHPEDDIYGWHQSKENIISYIEHHMEYDVEMVRKNLITIRDSEFIDEDSIDVVNKLLGDRKILPKTKITYDGSYLNNRIWVHVQDYKICLYIDNDYHDEDYEKFKKLSNKKKIDWLYNHYDTIFVQFPFPRNIDTNDLVQMIIEEETNNYYDTYYDFI